MVKLLNIAPIPTLNQTLNRVSHAGFVFKGEIKLFSLKRTAPQKALARKLKESFDAKYKKAGNNTNNNNQPTVQELQEFKRRVDVVLALTEVADDEDWDFLPTIDDYEQIDARTAIQDASEALVQMEKIINPSFSKDLWEVLRTEINIWNTEQCFVYRFSPAAEDDPFRYAGSMYASTLIFLNTHPDYRRVAVFWIRARSADFEDEEGEDHQPLKRVRLLNTTPSPVLYYESNSREATTPSAELTNTPYSSRDDDGDDDENDEEESSDVDEEDDYEEDDEDKESI
jgi:hypothetical protein